MNARSKEYEPILLFRMVGIRYKSAELVREGRFCLFKGDAMLLVIGGVLTRIPIKGKIAHALYCSYIVGIIKTRGVARYRAKISLAGAPLHNRAHPNFHFPSLFTPYPQSSIPFWALMPWSLKACLTTFISVTVSASSMSCCGA